MQSLYTQEDAVAPDSGLTPMADATPDGVSPEDRLRQHVVCALRLRVSPPQRLRQRQLPGSGNPSVRAACPSGLVCKGGNPPCNFSPAASSSLGGLARPKKLRYWSHLLHSAVSPPSGRLQVGKPAIARWLPNSRKNL